MSATVIFRESFAAGPSLFCGPGLVPQNGVGPYYIINDPLYPYIHNAESVKVLIGEGPDGQNVVDADYSGTGDHVVASVHFGKRLWNFTTGAFQFEVWCKPTTQALDTGIYGAIPIWIGNDAGGGTDTPPGVTLWQFIFAGGTGEKVTGPYDADFYIGGGLPDPPTAENVFTRAYIENRWIQFRVQGGVGNGVNDGWVKTFHRRQGETSWTPIHNATNIGWTTSTFSAVTFMALGYAGLFGQTTGLVVWNGIPDGDSATDSLGTCCATSGAAGGGTLHPDGTVTPVGYRQGVTSGVAPSYTACTGGGTLAAATDPTNPQSLDSIIDPILHVKFDLPVDGNQYWGEDSINAGTTSKAIEARVVRYGEIPSEVLAGRDGAIPTPTFSVTLQDTDRQLRGWSQHASKRFFLGRFAEVLAESYGQRQLDTEARKLAAGYAIDWKFFDELLAEFTFADTLGWKRGALKRRVPLQTVQTTWAPDAPEDSIGRPVPWIYGEMHDGYDWTLDPARLPVGIVGGIPVGKGYTLNMTNLLVPGMGTSDWEAFLIGKVCKNTPDNFYCWNGDNADAARGRLPVNVSFVTDWLLPSMSGWSTYFSNPYVRIVGTDGVTQDFTMAFLRGPRGYEARVTGRYPPTFNVCGIESVGDGSGSTILDGATALAHFICYGIFSKHTSGVWGGVPTLPNGAPVINVTSLAATKAIFDLRVTGGYPCGFAIGATGRDRRTGEEEITAKARGLDIQFGRNHFGQIVFNTVNDLAAISSLTAFDDSKMVDLSFWCHPRVDQQETIKRYTWGPEPSTGRTTGVEREIRDAAAITNWGEQGGDDVRPNEAVRRKAVADDVAMRELMRDSDVPHDGGFTSDLRGTSLSVGQLITITTQWAHWPSTEAHVVKITGLYPQGNATELLTRVTFEDVHRLMSLPSNALAGMVGPAWGQPIGSSVGLTSQPIGSSGAGTSRRLS